MPVRRKERNKRYEVTDDFDDPFISRAEIVAIEAGLRKALDEIISSGKRGVTQAPPKQERSRARKKRRR